LCPTYRHPKLLANAVACYLSQDYPLERRELIILDDYGQYENKSYDGYQVVSVSRRYVSFWEKRCATAALGRNLGENKSPDVYCAWDDDDVYMPWHITAHIEALKVRRRGRDAVAYSHPMKIFSTYGRVLHEEDGRGRFEGSFAFTRRAYEKADGWPVTKRGGGDQIFIGRLEKACGGKIDDPCEGYAPSYVYRWESTNSNHSSGYHKSFDDEEWYDRYAREANFDDEGASRIVLPQFDAETKQIYSLVDQEKGIGLETHQIQS
jgi:glycosyltransferase involved in cell wall biosynthesis